MNGAINLNSLLPAGIQLTPVFETDTAYREFRQRYEDELRPELDEQASKRRKSEEEARRRMLG